MLFLIRYMMAVLSEPPYYIDEISCLFEEDDVER